ncbi:IclR family transcriptional regulator [Streptomyces sp. HNM0575]|uniref:IclR family transcriptional regulator n=1 Tax=Streptomyces sp. HNM0575 TaxID=2716338 RepID=UPI00145C7614|nr:IclR family transcriptional regulator [Streptomyces sp. HNM0575]NLU74310.1 IclR family transcriptional regulator [Streptomyces sp. HNM0575]
MKKSPAPDPGSPSRSRPQYPIESVDNAMQILLLLGERSELRLTEVAKYLGVASSTAHRLLAMLQYRGFIRQDARSKAYVPGSALTGVAFSILQRFDVRQQLRPFLEELNQETGETVHLGVLDGATVRFIDAVESPRAVRVASRLGRSMPAHCTSTGKAMLTTLSTAQLHLLYPEEELPGLTEHSVRSRSDLEKEIAVIRRRGYATSSEESEEGVSSVAVAFPGEVPSMPLAFNTAVPLGRVSRTDVKRIGELLRTTVDRASKIMP